MDYIKDITDKLTLFISFCNNMNSACTFQCANLILLFIILLWPFHIIHSHHYCIPMFFCNDYTFVDHLKFSCNKVK